MRTFRVKTFVVAAIVICTLLVGSYSVFAATTQSTSTYSSIVTKLAEAFKLDPAKVQTVFDDQRKEMEAQRETQHKERLDQAVKDGTITEAQKTAILKKNEEMKAAQEDLKDLSQEERKTKMDNLRTELQTWAKANGLDQKLYLLQFGGRRGGPGGFGRGPGMGGPPGWGFGPPGAHDTTSAGSEGTGN